MLVACNVQDSILYVKKKSFSWILQFIMLLKAATQQFVKEPQVAGPKN